MVLLKHKKAGIFGFRLSFFKCLILVHHNLSVIFYIQRD